MIQITLYEDFVIPFVLPRKPESSVEAASLQWFQGLAVHSGYGPNYDTTKRRNRDQILKKLSAKLK